MKHAIRCVNVAEINGDEVVLAGASIPSTITSTRYRLYQRYVDFTTLANIEGLKRLDEQEDMDVIVCKHPLAIFFFFLFIIMIDQQ